MTLFGASVVEPLSSPPNFKLQLTIAEVARLATPSRAPFAIAAELGSYAA